MDSGTGAEVVHNNSEEKPQRRKRRRPRRFREGKSKSKMVFCYEFPVRVGGVEASAVRPVHRSKLVGLVLLPFHVPLVSATNV